MSSGDTSKTNNWHYKHSNEQDIFNDCANGEAYRLDIGTKNQSIYRQKRCDEDWHPGLILKGTKL